MITRYVLIDRDGNTEKYLPEFETFAEAKRNATMIPTIGHFAIIERQYEYTSFALVWTPDDWPNNPSGDPA